MKRRLKGCTLFNILLPVGTTDVIVREIPRLLALAIHPTDGDETKIITGLFKQENDLTVIPAPRSEPLDENDWALLNSIWFELPTYREGMGEPAWRPYAEALEVARYKPKWLLVVFWNTGVNSTQMQRFITESERREALHKAIGRRELMAVNESRLQLSANAIGEQVDRAHVSVEDFARYAKASRVNVQVAMPQAPALLSTDASACAEVALIGDGLDLPLTAQYERQARFNIAKGRCTLHEAAEILCIEAGEDNCVILTKLEAAAKSGVLPVFARGRNARIDYGEGARMSVFETEVFCDDLNEWIEANDPRIKYRFPVPLVVAPDSVIQQHAQGDAGASPTAQRQAGRYQECIEDGLTMPTDAYSHLPRGIGKVAKRLKISRPTLSADLKAHIERINLNATRT